MTPQQLPNVITLIRIALVAPLLWALLHGHFGLGLLLFVISAGSDFLDGFLARRYGWQTTLGAVLDPIADKLLLVTSYWVLGINGFLPWWLVFTVVGRDLVIVCGALAYRLLAGRFDMEPTLVSKLNTVLQAILALVTLVARGLEWLPAWSAEIFVYAVLASTLLSGVHYVVIWSKRAWLHAKVQG